MRHCAFCSEALSEGVPRAPVPGRRHAYDPDQGRLWEICPRCRRWNPVPMELRWEVLEAWEGAVRDRGKVLLEGPNLALIRVPEAGPGAGEVIRVGEPPVIHWAAWRYGERVPGPGGSRGILRRALDLLPPPPLEGYDPYGLSGGMAGVIRDRGASRWLASPFMEKAWALTVAFTTVPFAPACPSCGAPMPLNPWDFQEVAFVPAEAGGEDRLDIGLRAPCAHCGAEVVVPLREARPSLRLGLGMVDNDVEARKVAEASGRGLEQVGGGVAMLRGLARLGAPLGDLGREERVALGIALDGEAEAEALEAEWRRAEEIIAIMDGELTQVEGFREFRERVLEEEGRGG
jgi:hypothetical protein